MPDYHEALADLVIFEKEENGRGNCQIVSMLSDVYLTNSEDEFLKIEDTATIKVQTIYPKAGERTPCVVYLR